MAGEDSVGFALLVGSVVDCAFGDLVAVEKSGWSEACGNSSSKSITDGDGAA